jgi:hypothetical protein
MRRLAGTFTAVLLFGALGLAAPASAQTPSAVSVAQALIAAENAHNVAAAVALFAPGAIVVHATGQLVTTAEITAWQQELAAGNFRADVTTPVAVTPEVVTFSGTVTLDSFRSLGISSLAANWQLTVQQGKVTIFNFEFTPAATARLVAALGGAGATPAGSSSGGGSSAAQPSAAAAPAATTGRTLALTGADLGLATVGALSVVVGLMMVGLGRRPAVPRT